MSLLSRLATIVNLIRSIVSFPATLAPISWAFSRVTQICTKFVNYTLYVIKLRNFILQRFRTKHGNFAHFKMLFLYGAVHISRASPVNWADLSHENLYISRQAFTLVKTAMHAF